MRTEREMLDLILGFAKRDDRVRAVVMNGSRANPAAPRDMYQDYDIVYAVRDIRSFTDRHEWIDVFGERIMLQMPEYNRRPSGNGTFAYLILFRDGNRLDLSLVPTEKYHELDDNDSESILLFDKDGLVKPYPPPSDRDYHIKPPSALEFHSCCNNFWWCAQNVAKGIRRDELSYALFMQDRVLRDELHDMICWYIGMQTDFKVSAGKLGKYFKCYLSAEQYRKFTHTYTDSNYDHIWQALFAMGELFRELARAVAPSFGFVYPQRDDDEMTGYLRRVRALPPDAREIY